MRWGTHESLKKNAGLFNVSKSFTAIKRYKSWRGKVGRPPSVTLNLRVQNKSRITSIDPSSQLQKEQTMSTHGCPDVSPGCVGKEMANGEGKCFMRMFLDWELEVKNPQKNAIHRCKKSNTAYLEPKGLC